LGNLWFKVIGYRAKVIDFITYDVGYEIGKTNSRKSGGGDKNSSN
jgi:hypothetical protein